MGRHSSDRDCGKATLPKLRESFRNVDSIVQKLKVLKSEIDMAPHPPVNYVMLTEKGKKVAEKLKDIEGY